MFVGERIADEAWPEVERASEARIARLTLGTLDQDLGAAVDSLTSAAELLPEPDLTLPAVQAAMGGDTVSALDPTASGVDIMVLFGDPEVDGGIRFNQGTLIPGAPTLVGGLTGYRIALYANGILWTATDPAPDLATLDR